MILVVFFLNQAWEHIDFSVQAIETPKHFIQSRISFTLVAMESINHRPGSNPLEVYFVPRGSCEM